MPAAPALNVAVLMANGCSAASVASTLELLTCANALCQFRKTPPPFRLTTLSADGLPVHASGSLRLAPEKAIADVGQMDLVIIPGFMFAILPALPATQPLWPWLRDQYAGGATMAAICTGAFVLAETGLLDGHLATTHWAFADAFRKRYPAVRLQPNLLVTEDDRLTCSGGATAGLDLLLHLIRRKVSASLAGEVAKKLLVDTERQAQTPYMMTTFNTRHGDEVVRRIQDWMADHLATLTTLDDVAERFGLSPRTFIRRFKTATGMTPNTYLQNLRIERAKVLLESTRDSIERITEKVGYEDANSFRRLFRERTGISPGAYRRKFGICQMGERG